MKIAMALLTVTFLSGCAHKNWCPAAQKAEKAEMSKMNTTTSDELGMAQSAPVRSEFSSDMLTSPATIKQIQSKLNTLGMQSGPVDGIKGPMTTSALKRYQTSKGINVDGNVNSTTVSALNITEEDIKL